MYDSKTKSITFPHIIPTPFLDGKKYTINDAHGGSKKIVDLGLEVNSFYGGNIHAVFFMSDLGFYVCPRRESNEVLGFYVHDWRQVTEKGKEVIQRRFPDCEIIYDDISVVSTLTKEEREEKIRLKAEALERGASPEVINHATSAELVSLIKALESGVAEKPMASVARTDSVYKEEYTPVSETRAVPADIQTKARRQNKNFSI